MMGSRRVITRGAWVRMKKALAAEEERRRARATARALVEGMVDDGWGERSRGRLMDEFTEDRKKKIVGRKEEAKETRRENASDASSSVWTVEGGCWGWGRDGNAYEAWGRYSGREVTEEKRPLRAKPLSLSSG
jgi:hypothetical protein